MTGNELLSIANALICSGIAARVLLFRRHGARHRPWAGWLAYSLIVASASIPLRAVYAFISQHDMNTDVSEVVINAVMLAAVLKTRGNVVQIFKMPRS